MAAGLLAVGALAAPAEAGPRAVFDEHAWSFGTVERGAKVDHVFGVRNVGDALLRIEQVKSSCGCTVAVVSGNEVAPGAEGRIAVTLDTARMAGRVTKVVTAYTNDPETPAVGLAMNGDVLTDLVITPTPLYLGKVRHGEEVTRTVVVTPGRPDASYEVIAVEQAGPALRTKIEPRTDGPGQRLVVVLAGTVPIGRFNDQITLRTTSPREPLVTLPVFGSVEGDVVVLPPQVTFGVTRGGAVPERTLHIHNRGRRPLAVTRVKVPTEFVTYDLQPVVSGVEYLLSLRLRQGLKPGKVESAIEIFTDHPDEPRVVVPLYAVIRGRGPRG
jgi:Protein of unknown function (DUF1573)